MKISLVFIFLAISIHAIGLDQGQKSIVFKNGEIVEGTIIGKDKNSIIVKVNGKAEELPFDKIKSIYDINGQKVEFSDLSTSRLETMPLIEVGEKKRLQNSYSKVAGNKGRRIAGKILMGIGFAFVISGAGAWTYGDWDKKSAKSARDSERYSRDESFQRYSTFLVIGGAAIFLPGVIIVPNDKNETSLISVEKWKFSVNIPDVLIVPRNSEIKFLVASSRF